MNERRIRSDAVAYYFKKMGVGPLMGKRTWGGLVRNGGPLPLMDGTRVSAPTPDWEQSGEWVAENTGIARRRGHQDRRWCDAATIHSSNAR
jgi:hypothetical protein